MAGYQYDPALDAQLRAVQRGLQYTTLDTEKAQNRLYEDYGVGVANARQQAGWGQEDVQTGRTRLGEDYTRNLAMLDRSYKRLGNQQAGRARGMGVMSGGALVASAARRAANQAWDRQPIDTSYQRGTQDFDTRSSRIAQGLQSQIGQMGLGLTRGTEDAQTGLARAGVEASNFETDTAEQRRYLMGLVF